MYPADIIRILLDLLPDCRGAALTCRWWECVYRGTPDRRYWCARGTDERGTGDVRAPYVLPKMVLSTPPIWDESLTDLVMAKNIPALDAALTVLPEHICDDVVRCLITTATVHDMVPVVAYFQKLGLVEIDVACQCGSIKCFDIYDRNELSAALVSNCSKSYKTINWMIHNGYRKEAIQICTNWPGSTTKYMVREGLIPYSALRGRAQMWYHQYNEAGGEPLPPLVHVIRMWPIDGVRWYVEKMRACTHT